MFCFYILIITNACLNGLGQAGGGKDVVYGGDGDDKIEGQTGLIEECIPSPTKRRKREREKTYTYAYTFWLTVLNLTAVDASLNERK